MKKALTILIIAVMVLSLASCAAQGTTSQTTTGKTTEGATTANTTAAPGGVVLAELGAMPLITSGEYILSIGLPQSVQVTDYYDNYLTKFLEERSGLKFEFFFFPTNGEEAKQKLELMVSSSQELPDIVSSINVGNLGKENYGQQGIFLNLDDYMKNDTFWLNKSADLYLTDQEKKDMITFYTSSDGHMYQFPYVISDPTDDTALSLWIDKKWLEKLDLTMPKTTDDFYNVLKKFSTSDPNGNGTNDEIPFIGSSGWVSDPTFCILNAFLYFSPYRLNVDNGIVSAPFTTNEYRQGLEYLSKLVSENLLNPLAFTQDYASQKSMLDLTPDQDTIVGVFAGHPHTYFAVDSEKRTEYTSIPPLTGPEGVSYAPMELSGYGMSVHITKYAENPQLVFRFLDMMCQDENSLSVRFGKQGDDWRFATADETPSFEKYAPPKFWTSNLRWGTENNVIWNNNVFDFIPKGLFGASVKMTYDNPNTTYREEDWARSVAERDGKQPSDVITILIYTAEEQAEINDLQTNIQTFEAQQRVLFITGAKSLENDWDAYLTELKNIGVDRYLEIVQQCYNRMHKK